MAASRGLLRRNRQELTAGYPSRSPRFAHNAVLRNRAMLYVLEIDIPGDLFPAFAGSDHERMLLSPRDRAASTVWHTIFLYEPFRGGGIDEGHVDLVAVFPTELLE